MVSYPPATLISVITITTTRAPNYIAALTALRGRLERGLVVLANTPSVQGEMRWLRLACRSCVLYMRLVDAGGREAEAAFLASDLGAWFVDLEWIEPSDAARLLDGCTPRRAA